MVYTKIVSDLRASAGPQSKTLTVLNIKLGFGGVSG